MNIPIPELVYTPGNPCPVCGASFSVMYKGVAPSFHCGSLIQWFNDPQKRQYIQQHPQCRIYSLEEALAALLLEAENVGEENVTLQQRINSGRAVLNEVGNRGD